MNILDTVRNKYFIILIALIFIGGFLRLYNLENWLHFELDQSRDARVVETALENGPSSLPLLGPRAAGSYLRLGPAFYYIEYLSAILFGKTHGGMVFLFALFGTITIVLLYYVLREFFTKKISILLAALNAFSIYFIIYSRFAWNPNLLAPLTVLFFLTLIKTVNSEDEKVRGYWLIGGAATMAIATQMHFVAFLALPAIGVLYFLITRPKISIAFWVLSVSVYLLFYLPVIINDVKTGGANTQEFIKTFTERTGQDEGHTFFDKTIKGYMELSRGYIIILTGQEQATEFKTEINWKKGIDIDCNKSCKEYVYITVFALFALLASGIVLFIKLWKAFKISSKNNTRRKINQKNFLILTSIWSIITFILIIPIAFSVAPRFFLLYTPLPYIYLGFFLEYLIQQKTNTRKKIGLVLVYLVVSLLIILNVIKIHERFWQWSHAHTNNFVIDTDRILKEPARITYQQQVMIVTYIKENLQADKSLPVYFKADSQNERALSHIMEIHGIKNYSLKKQEVYKKGTHLLIFRSQSNLQRKIKTYFPEYTEIGQKEFGTLTLIFLLPEADYITHEEQIIDTPEEIDDEDRVKPKKGVPYRYLWKEIFY